MSNYRPNAVTKIINKLNELNIKVVKKFDANSGIGPIVSIIFI